MKDYLGYKDKICVVTGAASGMGKATCEILIDLGAKVYAMDLAPITLPVEKAIKLNLGDKESVDQAFKEVPSTIDKFFGIAGVSGVTTDFATTIRINFIGHRYALETYVIPKLAEDGAIAFMGSLAGTGWQETREELTPVVDAPDWDTAVAETAKIAERAETKGYGKMIGVKGYFMSKRMMNLYVKKMAGPLAEKGIRINIICPGSTETQLTDQWASLMDAKSMQGAQETRYAQPSEMAGPIVFANSDMATYMSGQNIYVDFAQNAIQEYTNPNREFPNIG
ncbi:SDR family oxidoreductase [Zhenpiania hominis]|uniref:SDR family oxidoreductase n=1 Tax=Zhenpiania hominis TaxID=2763644 RepID=UPI0039F53FDA